MKTKLCLQLDNNGYLVGQAVADESPLEPGVFLLPAGCIDAEIPEIPDDKRAKWNGSGFDIEDSPRSLSDTVPALDVQQGPPASVTMRQARLALLQSGMLTQVNDAISKMPGTQGDAARIEWGFSSTVERHQPLVQKIGSELGLTDAQIDDLFRMAADL